MLRRVIFVLVAAVLVSGQMCGVPAATTNANLPTCDRQWHGDAYGVAIDPPAGAIGPSGAPQGTSRLLWAEWQDATGRRYLVNVAEVTGHRLSEVVQANRDAAAQAGGQITEDRAYTFASGQTGWLLASTVNGQSSMDVFEIQGKYLYNAAVVPTTGATATDTAAFDQFLSSLCVGQ